MGRTLQGLQAAQEAGDDQLAQHFSGLADKANAAAEQALSGHPPQQAAGAPEDLKIKAMEAPSFPQDTAPSRASMAAAGKMAPPAEPPQPPGASATSFPLDMPDALMQKIQANIAPSPTTTPSLSGPPTSIKDAAKKAVALSRKPDPNLNLPPEMRMKNLRAEVRDRLATQFPFGVGDIKEMTPGMFGSINGEQLLKQLETGSAREMRAAADALLNRGKGLPVPGTVTGLLGLKTSQPSRQLPDEINAKLKEMEALERQVAAPKEPSTPIFPHSASDEAPFLGPPTETIPMDSVAKPGDVVASFGNADAMTAIKQVKSLATDPQERDFISRVESELGKEPKFFTLENLAVLLLFGAKGVMQKWMHEKNAYTSGKTRIGKEIAYERRVDAKEKAAKAEDRLSNERRDRQFTMTLADKATRNRLRAIDNQINSVEKDISRVGFRMQGSKPEDIAAALAPLEQQRAALQNAYNQEVERGEEALEALIEKRDKK